MNNDKVLTVPSAPPKKRRELRTVETEIAAGHCAIYVADMHVRDDVYRECS